MRMLVVGAGTTGGYFGGRLAQALKAQHALQLANVEAAQAVVASATASFEQDGRDWQGSTDCETGSSSTEASEKLSTTHAQLEAQLKQNRAQALAAERRPYQSFTARIHSAVLLGQAIRACHLCEFLIDRYDSSIAVPDAFQYEFVGSGKSVSDAN